MRTLTKYNELDEYVKAFGRKNMNLLIIVSRGGLGKTTISENALMELDPIIFKGHVTPLAMYKELLERNNEEKDFVAIFDDVDSLLQNKTNVALLKQICETKENRPVKYFTTSKLLGDLPQEFETSCKVLMLVNDLNLFIENPALKALYTRAHVVQFEPSNDEILEYLKSFSRDGQIVKFIESYIDFSKELNFRIYERAIELKKAKLDWKKEIINSLQIDSKLFEMSFLLETYKTDLERIKNFSGERASYYRTKKRFLEKIKK
jgi:hypothetical protein